MKKNYILFFTLLVFGWNDLYSQTNRYWIQFTDKTNTPYSTSNPNQFLSTRSILRRTNQNIPVTINDLPIDPAYIDSIKKIPGVSVYNRSKWFNAITISADTNAMKIIKTISFVNNTEQVKRYYRETSVEKERAVQTTLLRNNSTSSVYNYGPSFNQIDMLGGVCLHDKGYDGKGMVIAVMDAGFYGVDTARAYDSLRVNHQILGTWDFVDSDSTVYAEHTHGAFVLSTLGGNLPGVIVGTAPKAQYWLLRTEDGATEYVIEEDNWVSAAEFADSVGADIFSTSLGYTEFDNASQNHTYADMDGNTARISIATDIAASKGILPVCSAGNSGGTAWNFIGAPADADSVLAVGAVDSLGKYALFSSQGPSFDGRVKPNVVAQGQDAVVTNFNAGIFYVNGTSFSCPITAGLVACLWQAHPTLTNMQILNAIEQTASQYEKPDSLLGHGVSNFCAAHDSLVSENKVVDMFEVFPNPSSGKVYLKIKGIQNLNIKNIDVYNALGSIVSSMKISGLVSDYVVNLSSRPKGVYFIKINSDKGSTVKKVILD